MNKVALIVVDMQKDGSNPDGLTYYPQINAMLPNISRVIETAREEGAMVIFLQHCYRAGKFDKNLIKMRPCCIEGTGGEEIDPRLDVRPEDYQIKKRRYSGFFGTDLDLVLRENDVRTVFIVGAKTNCCVRSTVTDAYYLDYNVVVIRECVATNDDVVNEVHLTDIHKYFGRVISLDEFTDALRTAKKGNDI